MSQILVGLPQRDYRADSLTVGIFFGAFLFFAFLTLGVTDATLRTDLLILMLFPLIAFVGRMIAGPIYSVQTVPFIRNPNNWTWIGFGIIGVFLAQLATVNATPVYSVVLSNFPGAFFGLIPYRKIFYATVAVFEESFFRFGLQAYFEQAFRSPVVAWLVDSGVFGAYHQFVFQYFSLVIVASSAVLSVMFYISANININILIHGSVNFIVA